MAGFALIAMRFDRELNKLKLLGRLFSILTNSCLVVRSLLLLVTRLLPRDGGMAEDHGAPEAGQLPKVWTRGRKETESRQ